jgi:hypothetical protein
MHRRDRNPAPSPRRPRQRHRAPHHLQSVIGTTRQRGRSVMPVWSTAPLTFVDLRPERYASYRGIVAYDSRLSHKSQRISQRTERQHWICRSGGEFSAPPRRSDDVPQSGAPGVPTRSNSMLIGAAVTTPRRFVVATWPEPGIRFTSSSAPA